MNDNHTARARSTAAGAHRTRQRRWRFAIPAVAALGGAVIFGTAGATPSSRSVKGNLTSQSVAGPTCSSPIGLCAVGEMKGTFNGPFEFVANSLVPADKPGVLFMTGVSIIHDEAGDVRFDDSRAPSMV